MNNKIFKPLSKTLLVASLIAVLVFSNAGQALAARSGGRIGGGSFRRPAPTRTYQPPLAIPAVVITLAVVDLGFPF